MRVDELYDACGDGDNQCACFDVIVGAEGRHSRRSWATSNLSPTLL